MKSGFGRKVLGALALAALPLPVFATTATSLSSFIGIEEPSDRVSSTGTVTPGDSYVNITSPSSGVFRFELRYSSSAWDGDRDTGSTDRGRAEVKGLGALQGTNETFHYKSTWKTSSSWALTSTNRFCHITQLKGVDGSNGAPLVVQSIENTTWNANVRYCIEGGECSVGLATARSYSFTANTPKTVEIHIKTSTGGSGEVKASVNGDAFSGATGLSSLYLNGTTAFRPKWGLYRGFDAGMGLSNHYIEHSAVNAWAYTGATPTSTPTPTPAAATPTPTPTPGGGGSVSFEAENVAYTHSGTGASVQSDANCSGGTWISLDAENTGSWLEVTTPTIAAGTYSLKMSYKTNNNRGQLSMKVDGTQVGGTVDQYAALPSAYPTVTFGNVTFSSSGTHKLRLTVTGKNGSSSSYVLSADKFTLQ